MRQPHRRGTRSVVVVTIVACHHSRLSVSDGTGGVKFLKRMLVGVGALLFVGAVVLWVGAAWSLDRSGRAVDAARALPVFDAQIAAATPVRVRIEAGEHTFTARVAGFGGARGNLILLHGFPVTSAMWEPLIGRAAAAGYQVVAFDQRGYSHLARPANVEDYALPKLVGDVLRVADAVGFDDFHLGGHDWGAAVGWSLVMTSPDRVKTWMALSVPHLVSFGRAIEEDPEQQRRSSYMMLFWTPWLPEQLAAFNDFAAMRSSMYAEHDPDHVAEYIDTFSVPGALTAALNWYRVGAAPDAATVDPSISLPTLFVGGNRDVAIAASGVEDQRRFMVGPFEELALDSSHWLMESRGDEISAAMLEHMARFGGS